MFKKIAIASSTAAVIFALMQAAWATSSAPQPINLSATVNKNCLISVPPVDPSALTYDPVSANASGGSDVNTSAQVTFNCTRGSTGVTVAVNNGLHFASSTRNLSDGATPTANLLAYNAYKPTASGSGATCSTTDYSAGAFAVSSSDFVTGQTAVIVKVCVNIPKGQDAIPATYTDTINLTVNF